MTQEKTPDQLRAEAEALEQYAYDVEDPTHQRGVNRAVAAEYQRKLTRIRKAYGDEAAKQLDDQVQTGAFQTWDQFDDAVDGLRSGGARPAYGSASPVAGMHRPSMSLSEAERRYILPSGHPDRITHEEFRELKKQHGARY